MIKNWFMSSLNDFFVSLMNGIIEAFGGFINDIFKVVMDANNTFNFDRLTKYSIRIALGYVVLKAIKQGLDVYVFETQGDSENNDPLELLTRTAQSCAVIYCGSYALDLLINIAGTASDTLVSLIPQATDVKPSYTNSFTKLSNEFYGGTTYKTNSIGFVFILILLAMLIASLIFIFHAGKRGAELTLFKFLLPIIATDLLTASRDRWNQFKSELIVCVFGYILQVMSFNIFLTVLAKSADDIVNSSNYLWASLGWLILVISAPKWIAKFSYSSGVGNGAKGGARSLVMFYQMRR